MDPEALIFREPCESGDPRKERRQERLWRVP